MLNFSRIAKTFAPSSPGRRGLRRPAGIGVRSAPTLRGQGESAESRMKRNALRNLAVLARTPSSSLLATIRSAHPDKELIIVGVDGPTGAGRTQLCEEMKRRDSDVTVISAADFRKPLDRTMLAGLSSSEVFEEVFDWQRLRGEVLEPLSKGKMAVYRRGAGPAGSGEWTRVEPRGIVLFEGVYTLRPELYPFYDYTVFVKPALESETESERGVDPEAWYQDAYHPASMADTLLEGDWF